MDYIKLIWSGNHLTWTTWEIRRVISSTGLRIFLYFEPEIDSIVFFLFRPIQTQKCIFASSLLYSVVSGALNGILREEKTEFYEETTKFYEKKKRNFTRRENRILREEKMEFYEKKKWKFMGRENGILREKNGILRIEKCISVCVLVCFSKCHLTNATNNFSYCIPI